MSNGFPIKETMRVTSLRRSKKAISERQHQLIALLGEKGPMRAAPLAVEMGYSSWSAATGMLNDMVASGRIVRTGYLYHLRGQSVTKAQQEYPNKEAKDFFVGDSLSSKLRRYLRDHQDEPLLVSKMAEACGYATSTAAGGVIQRMLDSGVLRRYRAPEDRFFQWRYQYTPPEHSGVTVTSPAQVPQKQSFAELSAEQTTTPSWGELIKADRATKSESQKAYGARFGRSNKAVHNWEHDRNDVPLAVKFQLDRQRAEAERSVQGTGAVTSTTEKAAYSCKHCSFMTDDRFGLARHYRNEHPGSEKIQCKQEGCSFIAKSQFGLRAHVRLDHPTKAPAPEKPVQTATPVEPEPSSDRLPVPDKAFAAELTEEIDRFIEGELAQASHFIEKYARDFFWQTGSRDVRELVIWMKERRLAEKGE